LIPQGTQIRAAERHRGQTGKPNSLGAGIAHETAASTFSTSMFSGIMANLR
jgi:hypothetical protein